MKKLCAFAVLGWGLMSATSANAMSLIEAVRIAVHSNPEIGEAIANREAIEFELQQGRGLFRPEPYKSLKTLGICPIPGDPLCRIG